MSASEKKRGSGRPPVLFLLVGPPGSGKSTAAAALRAFGTNPNGTLLFSTDDLFVQRKASSRQYVFTGKREEARLHGHTLAAVTHAASAPAPHRPDLVVHNTFLYFEEREPYLRLAAEKGYELQLLLTKRSVECSPYHRSPGGGRCDCCFLPKPLSFYSAANQHRVPLETLRVMTAAFGRFLRDGGPWSFFEPQLGDFGPVFRAVTRLAAASHSTLSLELHALQDLLRAWGPGSPAFPERCVRLVTFLGELVGQAHSEGLARRLEGVTLFCQHYLLFLRPGAPVWAWSGWEDWKARSRSPFWRGRHKEWVERLWSAEEGALEPGGRELQEEILPSCSPADLVFLYLLLCSRCSREHDKALSGRSGASPLPSPPSFERAEHLRAFLGVFLRALVHQEPSVTVLSVQGKAAVVLRGLTKCSQGSYRVGPKDAGDAAARLEIKSGSRKGEARLFSMECHDKELTEIARARLCSEGRGKMTFFAPPGASGRGRRGRVHYLEEADAVLLSAGASRAVFLSLPCGDLRDLLQPSKE